MVIGLKLNVNLELADQFVSDRSIFMHRNWSYHGFSSLFWFCLICSGFTYLWEPSLIFKFIWFYLSIGAKGQLISKCPYEKSVSFKIPTKIFLGFLPWKFTTSRLVQNRVYLLANRT